MKEKIWIVYLIFGIILVVLITFSGCANINIPPVTNIPSITNIKPEKPISQMTVEETVAYLHGKRTRDGFPLQNIQLIAQLELGNVQPPDSCYVAHKLILEYCKTKMDPYTANYCSNWQTYFNEKCTRN